MKRPILTQAVRDYMSFIGRKAKGTKKTLTPEQRKQKAKNLAKVRLKFRWRKKAIDR